MIKDGVGGANTMTGLAFEGKTDLANFLNKQNGYRVEKDKAGRNTGMILLRERKNNKDG